MNKNWAIAIIVIIALGASNVYLLLRDATQESLSAPKPAQAPATLEKFKAAGGRDTAEWFFLIINAGKDRGIWAKHGLDPEFVTIPRPILTSDHKEWVASGVKIGFTTQNVLLARAEGVPVKIVAAYLTGDFGKLYTKGDSSIRNVKDLDGKKVGILTLGTASDRTLLYISKEFGIKIEIIALGNLTNQVVALKLGRIDAMVSYDGAALRLVDSGELRILLDFSDLAPELKPRSTGLYIYATDDIIQQNPDLVKRFVKATLEVVQYLKENPSYAAKLYMERTRAPKDLADKVVSQLQWTPNRRGGGSDLVVAVANFWKFAEESGGIPANIDVKIEDAVETRFLP